MPNTAAVAPRSTCISGWQAGVTYVRLVYTNVTVREPKTCFPSLRKICWRSKSDWIWCGSQLGTNRLQIHLGDHQIPVTAGAFSFFLMWLERLPHQVLESTCLRGHVPPHRRLLLKTCIQLACLRMTQATVHREMGSLMAPPCQHDDTLHSMSDSDSA